MSSKELDGIVLVSKLSLQRLIFILYSITDHYIINVLQEFIIAVRPISFPPKFISYLTFFFSFTPKMALHNIHIIVFSALCLSCTRVSIQYHTTPLYPLCAYMSRPSNVTTKLTPNHIHNTHTLLLILQCVEKHNWPVLSTMILTSQQTYKQILNQSIRTGGMIIK